MISAVGVSFNTNQQYMYIGGRHQSQLLIAKIDYSSGNILIASQITQSGSSQLKQISALSLYDKGTSDMNQLACANYLGNSESASGILYFDESSGVNSLLYAWYFDLSQTSICLDVKLEQTKFYYLMNLPQQSKNYFGTMDITSTSTQISVMQIRLSSKSESFYPSKGLISSDGSFYYDVGNTTYINNNKYDRDLGYVMKYPVNSGCLQTTPSSVTLSVTYQSSFNSGIFSQAVSKTLPSSSVSYDFQALSSVSEQSLTSLNIEELPSTCMNSIFSGTISFTNIPTQVYYINDPSLEFIVQAFTYSQACSETLIWTYQATLSNGNALPSFIGFTVNNNLPTFTIFTADSSKVKSYAIFLVGTLQGTQSQRQNIHVQIKKASNAPGGGSGGGGASLVENNAPIYQSDLVKVVQIYSDQSETINLPNEYDQDDNLITRSISIQFWNNIPDFIEVQEHVIKLHPSSKDIGNYLMTIKLTDDDFFNPLNGLDCKALNHREQVQIFKLIRYKRTYQSNLDRQFLSD
ncbi:UNKNOWN [Stylonychia lemnae]|uniref:Uncharacterized protein n=1 Tax=Stylonychia lemnae TaxID=5949 RepID=A0A078ANC9_STYLE|nr:UNKNOWN [Stylonychia lemnae]|eukprot:CDW82448.1 UNKNOWN [Stylonychia lemnae]